MGRKSRLILDGWPGGGYHPCRGGPNCPDRSPPRQRDQLRLLRAGRSRLSGSLCLGPWGDDDVGRRVVVGHFRPLATHIE
jgi:hypothetical protein